MSRLISGNRAWIVQRVSAIYLALYFVAALACLAWYGAPADHAAWKALLAAPWMNLATLGFVAALLLHAWVGGRDVIVDYLHPVGLRLAALTGLALMLILCALWAGRILLQVLA